LHTGLVGLGQVPRVPRDLDRDARQRPAVQQTSPALRTALQQPLPVKIRSHNTRVGRRCG
jgi:hypothetical protein